jgi:cell wall-associated NlpC family hydrolase
MRRATRAVAASALALPVALGMPGLAAASTHSAHPQHSTRHSAGSRAHPLVGTGAAVTAVNAALRKQGSPYATGRSGPSSFDCSGLVQYAYGQAGIALPSSTKEQKTLGRPVSQADLRPGDVLFFYRSGSHAAVYVGDGKVVHAPGGGQGVKVENYEYIGPINTIRRFAG